MTFLEVDQKARAIAAQLQSLGAQGERALILNEFSPDYIIAFLGCIYAGVIPVPCEPLHARGAENRARAIARHTKAKFISSGDSIPSKASNHQELSHLHPLTNNVDAESLSSQWVAPNIEEHSLAFLQYTSGSTRSPKGVMISHGNLIHQNMSLCEAGRGGPSSTFVGWLPLFHDMGLIGNVMQPLFLGSCSVIMPPMAFLRRPARWLQAVSKYKAETSGGPDFAYRVCCEKLTEQDMEGSELDLSSWRNAFIGAEMIRHETLVQFTSKFARFGFSWDAWFPCYGLAESTLMATGAGESKRILTWRANSSSPLKDNFRRGKGDFSKILVSSGRAWLDQKVVIVDPDKRVVCDQGVTGEIWISGPSVAMGYWNERADDVLRFGASVVGDDSTQYLRTGDLGFLRDGYLFVTGRMKDVVLIRGRTYHAEDLEWTVEQSVSGVHSHGAAAFSLTGRTEEQLVLVCEIHEYLTEDDLETCVASIDKYLVLNHGIHAHAVGLVRRGSIPRTTSGKIQRNLCRKALLDGSMRVVKLRVLGTALEADLQLLEP